MAHILYNAWDSLYKEPFGAVKIGHEVVWRLQVFQMRMKKFIMLI